ncbi:piggyBac transposable element-derived protein 4-like [Mugil cephalus]|uniref:piggyBac transposable element-derived protein 4-like n=1 Tax=Mugil cephalus TaxID=48193 RepID=UPI001FB700E4|nr:piggyBac transposable element-derived protein 4-like [Mugil cephalus]
MRRSLNVQEVIELLFGEEECEPISSSSSGEESDVEGDEVTDPSLDSDEENGPIHRGHRRTSPKRSRSPQAQPHHRSGPWRTGNDPDTAKQISPFMPRRTPGAQVDARAVCSPLDLFQLYFSPTTVLTLCRNTNRYAANNKEMGNKSEWADVEVEEFYKFLGLLKFMSLVSLPSIEDYWAHSGILSVPFPASVMAWDRFSALLWNVHPSDPEEDVKNDEKKGTPAYDKLFRIKPLMEDILTACQAHYHPRKELAVGERVVATEAKTGTNQFMNAKPARRGIKLFVLADSSNGYTVNFDIYMSKAHARTAHGLAYDAVMHLIQPSHLGTGYHVYMDSFFTSPQLFLDLAGMKFGACGTYRDNMKGCPTGRENALTSRSERGTVRWIREGSLVFLKWMDKLEVSVCSTIHPAASEEFVKRRLKGKDGRRVVKNVPYPALIIAYNKNMGVFDPSNQCHPTHRRTTHWYRTLFLHLVDIAAANAYILHCDVSASNRATPMSRKDFHTELVSQLCGADMTGAPTDRTVDHVPVAIATVTDASLKASRGRRKCQH